MQLNVNRIILITIICLSYFLSSCGTHDETKEELANYQVAFYISCVDSCGQNLLDPNNSNHMSINDITIITNDPLNPIVRINDFRDQTLGSRLTQPYMVESGLIKSNSDTFLLYIAFTHGVIKVGDTKMDGVKIQWGDGSSDSLDYVATSVTRTQINVGYYLNGVKCYTNEITIQK